MGRFRFLEDVAVADAAVEVEGRDLNDLFETAASSLAALMVDPASLRVAVERRVTLTASRLDLLLYDWLAELIYRKDRDQEVFPSTEVRVTGAGPFRLTADLRGGVIDPVSTTRRADPKAVTLHQFALEPRNGGWWARIVIDI